MRLYGVSGCSIGFHGVSGIFRRVPEVQLGSTRFHWVPEDSTSSRGFQEFQGVSEYSRGLGYSKSSRGFQEFKGVSEDSRGLGDYRGFQGITGGFRRLQGAHRFSLLINSLINF